MAEGIAKANKGQLYTTLLIFFKITKINSIKRELDTDAAITFKSFPTFDFHFEFIISFCSFILIWNWIPNYAENYAIGIFQGSRYDFENGGGAIFERLLGLLSP